MTRQRDMINPTATTITKPITAPAINILNIWTAINPPEVIEYAINIKA